MSESSYAPSIPLVSNFWYTSPSMNAKRHIFLFLLLTVLLSYGLAASSPVYALKKRVRAPGVRYAGGSFSSARLSRPTNSVVVTFVNLSQVKGVRYTLSYTANGIRQGVVGSFVPSGEATASRDLYFGTCSKGVCTPHYGIRGATLTVTTNLKSGATNVKRYRIKV